MTRMELIAVRGIVAQIEVRKMEPKPDWMKDERRAGKTEAYDEVLPLLRQFIEAGAEGQS